MSIISTETISHVFRQTPFFMSSNKHHLSCLPANAFLVQKLQNRNTKTPLVPLPARTSPHVVRVFPSQPTGRRLFDEEINCMMRHIQTGELLLPSRHTFVQTVVSVVQQSVYSSAGPTAQHRKNARLLSVCPFVCHVFSRRLGLFIAVWSAALICHKGRGAGTEAAGRCWLVLSTNDSRKIPIEATRRS